MRALIDGDIVIRRAAHGCDQEPLERAIEAVDEYIHNIAFATDLKEARIFLSDSKNNFRKELFPEYKANRPKEKPQHLDTLKEYLLDEYKAEITSGQEADDMMGIEQDKNDVAEDCTTIICTIDKDLRQVPGRHYNFVTNEHFHVCSAEGTYFFYKQLLTGDYIDNVKGIPRVGDKKAKRILGTVGDTTNRTSEFEYNLFDRCLKAYEKHFAEDARRIMLLYGQVLKIRTKENEIWTFPQE